MVAGWGCDPPLGGPVMPGGRGSCPAGAEAALATRSRRADRDGFRSCVLGGVFLRCPQVGFGLMNVTVTKVH